MVEERDGEDGPRRQEERDDRRDDRRRDYGRDDRRRDHDDRRRDYDDRRRGGGRWEDDERERLRERELARKRKREEEGEGEAKDEVKEEREDLGSLGDYFRPPRSSSSSSSGSSSSSSSSPKRRKTEDKKDQQYWGKKEDNEERDDGEEEEEEEKEEANFKLSGKLAAETNTVNGVVLKWAEPPEARKPKAKWRIYPFKEGKESEPIPLHRQSSYLFGRDELIADIPIRHPSCSKQHAVLQWRQVTKKGEEGFGQKVVKPYIMDLNSTNGVLLNGKKIKKARYTELIDRDVLKFGFSTREYVVLNVDAHDLGDDED